MAWLKIKVLNSKVIGQSTTFNINLDTIGVIIKILGNDKGDAVVFGGVNGIAVPKSSLSEAEWKRICKIVEDLSEA